MKKCVLSNIFLSFGLHRGSPDRDGVSNRNDLVHKQFYVFINWGLCKPVSSEKFVRHIVFVFFLFLFFSPDRNLERLNWY